MTEEDQKLVALAALHGARFIRIPRSESSIRIPRSERVLLPVNWHEDNAARLALKKLFSSEMFWGTEQYPMKKYTVARAAEHYLFNEGLRSRADHDEYQDRTFDLYTYAQDVDEAFVASALAGNAGAR